MSMITVFIKSIQLKCDYIQFVWMSSVTEFPGFAYFIKTVHKVVEKFGE